MRAQGGSMEPDGLVDLLVLGRSPATPSSITGALASRGHMGASLVDPGWAGHGCWGLLKVVLSERQRPHFTFI